MLKEGWYIIDHTKQKPVAELILDAADAYERARPGSIAVIAEVAEEVDIESLGDLGLRIVRSRKLKPHHVIAGV